ncbi:hypothetical protein HFO45_06860 [Rhizobium leguminosarum]|uniref:hypothetical protein n=1 Tax=Rhizobium TaxID=379 RepID=UPI00103CF9DD|nr:MULTISPECIES: hypothetical protein [Rhizobium]MBY5647977.1 hypothetical protein [Rhizobium leguminosarum]TBY07624.1 hypothetical protein E0J21_15790 [Rhizobium laguerreae]
MREEDEAMVFELVHSSLKALGAAYLAILVGMVSVLGDAADNKDLAHALYKMLWPLMVGFASTGVGLVASHHFFHQLKKQTRKDGRIGKFSVATRILFWMSAFSLSGSMGGLMAVFVALYRFLKTVG